MPNSVANVRPSPQSHRSDAAAQLKCLSSKAQTALQEQRATVVLREAAAPTFWISPRSSACPLPVNPDTARKPRNTNDKNTRPSAVRVARNFEVDPYNAAALRFRPQLQGYDSKPRANGEIVDIEVKGRAGRGPPPDGNEWPTAPTCANGIGSMWLPTAPQRHLYQLQAPLQTGGQSVQEFHGQFRRQLRMPHRLRHGFTLSRHDGVRPSDRLSRAASTFSCEAAISTSQPAHEVLHVSSISMHVLLLEPKLHNHKFDILYAAGLERPWRPKTGAVRDLDFKGTNRTHHFSSRHPQLRKSKPPSPPTVSFFYPRCWATLRHIIQVSFKHTMKSLSLRTFRSQKRDAIRRHQAKACAYLPSGVSIAFCTRVPSSRDSGADYCNWAIYRKLKKGDSRLCNDSKALRSEYYIFERNNMQYRKNDALTNPFGRTHGFLSSRRYFKQLMSGWASL
jgi:hypothetical protein